MRSKRKRSDLMNKEDKRISKAIKAIIAQLQNQDLKVAFLVIVINGIKIPQNYKEAINNPKYANQQKEAIAEELRLLIANRTQKEVTPLKGINLVLTKQVYTIKTKVNSLIKRFKARLVARGFSQVHSQDYTKTFAPIVRIDTLQIFLAIVAAKDLKCA